MVMWHFFYMDDDMSLHVGWRVKLIHFAYIRGKCDPKKPLGANLILSKTSGANLIQRKFRG